LTVNFTPNEMPKPPEVKKDIIPAKPPGENLLLKKFQGSINA
jgi:hypothetical protein